MCGIAGYVAPDRGNPQLASARARCMQGALSHRGPDADGEWVDLERGVGLFHRRLSIIDLSSGANQPLWSTDRSVCVCFNGEIYNYSELADQLGLPNDSSVRSSDTAVLAEGIARWGLVSTLKRCLGMYALAVWSEREQRLLLARDPAGKKPLYYGVFDNTLHFGSEISAFRAVREFRLSVSQQALSNYLTFGFVDTPGTIFSEVQALPPGAVSTVSRNLELSFEKFFDPVALSPVLGSARDLGDEVETLLSDAVRLRLRSDVPLGCLLSGGIDSGLVAALAMQQLRQPLKTFTIALKGGAMNEGPLAAATARHLGTEHHEILVSPDVRETLPKVVQSFGQPFGDPSALPAYVVCQEARKYVTVVLSGEGADEIFCGYRRHRAFLWADRLRVISRLTPAIIFRMFEQLSPRPRRYRSSYAFLHRFLRGLGKSSGERYLDYSLDGFTENEKEDLLSVAPTQSSLEVIEGRLRLLGNRSESERLLLLDFLFTLHDDMLIKVDISSMAHALEARCPFLDSRVVSWGLSKPIRAKLWGTENKPILRMLARKHLPAAVAAAPKRGFEIPVAEWLQGDLSGMAHEIILDPNGFCRSLMRKERLERLLRNDTSLDSDRWSRRVWRLLVLGLWGRT